MGILDGKNIVVTGVLTDASLAYGVAKLALAEGAQVMLTGAGRGLSITERTARKLSTEIKVVEFDVTVNEHIASARDAAKSQFGRVCCMPSALHQPYALAMTSWPHNGRMFR
jgi:enoyl-[acyl-carrier protein] reductase I